MQPNSFGRLAIRVQPQLRHPATPGCRATWKVLAREFSLQGNRPLIFRFYLKQNPPRLFGDEFGKTVGPFDHGEAVTEEVIIDAKSFDGLSVFHTKKIQVVNGQSSSSIFVQDGESGARDTGIATQPGDETFDEGRFTAPQVSLESQNRSDADMLCESPSKRFRLSRTVGNERSHLVTFDFRLSIFD